MKLIAHTILGSIISKKLEPCFTEMEAKGMLPVPSLLIDMLVNVYPVIKYRDKRIVDDISELLHQSWLKTMDSLSKTEKLSEETLAKIEAMRKPYPFLEPEQRWEYKKWASVILKTVRLDTLKEQAQIRNKTGLSLPQFFKTGVDKPKSFTKKMLEKLFKGVPT